ncbi:hypothetical protein GMSM_20150 [Geomonas sp. Red276]
MKKIYLNHLKKELRHRIPDELTGFEFLAVKVPSADKQKSHLRTNEQIFARNFNDKLLLFLCITPDIKQEAFWLEIGWSNRGRFPYDINFLLADIDETKSEFQKDEYVFNYNCLYALKKDKALPSHSTWKVWQCSVPVNDPTYAAKFIAESLAPVSEEMANQMVNQAINMLIEDVKRIVLPYFEERIVHFLKTNS